MSCRMYLSENTSFVSCPLMEWVFRQRVVMQHCHTILLSVLQVGKQCLQNVAVIRASASCRLSPSMGLGPLLAVWDEVSFKSCIYWTATQQLKKLLETEVCQRYISDICRKSVAFFTFHMKYIYLVLTFVSVWKLIPISLKAVFSPETMIRASLIYSSVLSCTVVKSDTIKIFKLYVNVLLKKVLVIASLFCFVG